eukprot:GFYU01004267.1.p1 GENE.GFYU01004267.1~~GFYU01004267.1.p1  ORF type:complete len:672 (+),score=268.94 GFYU01004267.1:49-2016(+)
MKVIKEITSWLFYGDDDKKLNGPVTFALLNARLIMLPDYDQLMVKYLESSRNQTALELCVQIARKCVLENETVAAAEIPTIIDFLSKVQQSGSGPDGLGKTLEDIRTSAERKAKVSGRDSKDPPGMREQVTFLFEEWITQVLRVADDNAYTQFVNNVKKYDFLNADDTVDRFFRILMELCVDNADTMLNQPQATPNPYQAAEAYAKLVIVLLKYWAEPNNKMVSTLNKVLQTTARVLMKDYEVKKDRFNQRPYYRFFSTLLNHLQSVESQNEDNNYSLLLTFASVFHGLQPLRIPVFCFAWLELISSRMFMPKLLLAKNQKGWQHFQKLLIDLFKFLEPYLRTAELTEPVRVMYKGTLRVLLVLLHDFPEFLCNYHFAFCDAIPPTCIQMRNLILSAFPRNMRLPDPFTPNLKVDLLPEINQPPRILFNFTASVTYNGIKNDIDNYIAKRAARALNDLKQKLLLPAADAANAGTKYNVPVMNATVLYIGVQALDQLRAKGMGQQFTIQNMSPMDIFVHLAVNLDTEGRYLFLNAIANQLRYPNNHTYYFSCVLLYLFAEAREEIIQEQITRVLLERLIVHRPHPWGLLITFIELIKNPRYNFWTRAFTRGAPEIERLFEQVARSCMGPVPSKPGDEDPSNMAEGSQPTMTSGVEF